MATWVKLFVCPTGTWTMAFILQCDKFLAKKCVVFSVEFLWFFLPCVSNEKNKVVIKRESVPHHSYSSNCFCITFKSFLAFGCSPLEPVDRMCSYIPGDANLYTLFRVDGHPVSCPFFNEPPGQKFSTLLPLPPGGANSPPFAFSYNRGKGECEWPASEMESCLDPTRLVLQFQACPNVPGTEMTRKLNQGFFCSSSLNVYRYQIWHWTSFIIITRRILCLYEQSYM